MRAHFYVTSSLTSAQQHSQLHSWNSSNCYAAEVQANEELSTCVRAAEGALQQQQTVRDEAEDSDGGWGHAQEDGGDSATGAGAPSPTWSFY